MTTFLLAQSSAVGSPAIDLLCILTTAGLTAMLLSRLHMAVIPGFLIAGALIGPHAAGLVSGGESSRTIAQFSTILLMFTIGLQLDIARVRAGVLSIVGGAMLATVCMIAIGWPLAALFTGRAPAGLAICMAMAIAATAAPLRLLESRRDINTMYGRLAFGITLFQDLIAVAILALLPAIGHWAGAGDGGAGRADILDTVRAGLIAIAGVGALVVGGRLLLPRVLAEAGKFGGDVLIVLSAAAALGSAMFTAALGLSPELGAFLSGFLLAGTPLRHQIAGQLIPMRDLFLAVFFTSVGLSLPLGMVAQGWWIVLLGLVALGVIKVAGITFSAWALGAPASLGLLAAVTLAPAGEFTIVLLAQAHDRGIISDSESGYAIGIVVLSIIAAPLIFRLGHSAAPRLRGLPNAPWIGSSALRVPEPDAPTGDERRPLHAVVAGFGPVGRAVADRLEEKGIAVTIVELNPKTVARQSSLGRRVVYGDAANPQVMESAGVGSTDAVVLTIPDEEAMLRACRVIRALNQGVFLAVRANVLSRALTARQFGADETVVEEMVTAEAMAQRVVDHLQRRMGRDDRPGLEAAPPS